MRGEPIVKTILTLLVSGLFAILLPATLASAAAKTDQIVISYQKPQNPAHKAIYEDAKNRKVLERLKEFLSPFRLLRPVKIQMTGCDGDASADYWEGEITICYEFVEGLRKNMPDAITPGGVVPIDTVIGPFVDTVLHEFSHAVFDMFFTPIFGREEDAADQLAAYLYLQLNETDARRLVLGTVYNYLVVETNDADSAQTAEEFIEDSAETHSLPSQRAYNLMCVAYGANSKLFEDFVVKKLLPDERAEVCVEEFEQLQQAYKDLIAPHVDSDLADVVFEKSWLRKMSD
jgi:hypothetical protein